MPKIKTEEDNQLIFTSEKIEEIRVKNEDGYKISRFEKYWYSNLELVRRANLTFSLSDDEAYEYMKCKLGIDEDGDPYVDPNTQVFNMSGIDYFAETYCKVKNELGSIKNIKLRNYQKNILNMYMENRFSCLVASRQIGKCYLFDTEVITNDNNIMKVYKIWFYNIEKKSIYDYVKYTIYTILDFLK